MKILNYFFCVVLFIWLTITTQIGGIILVFSVIISRLWANEFKFKGAVVFIVLYLSITFTIVPLIAPIFGRETISHSENVKPTNFMTVLLNRNYVKPQLNELLQETAKELKSSNIQISYLDANFPFIDKFPLLPHLSHSDGKKIDLSLIYETKKGVITTKQKSISGYGEFEAPSVREYNQIEKCFKRGYFQYDYPKYLTLGKINKDLIFSKKGTKKLIKSILKNTKLGKILIEPHLKQRLNLKHNKVRYHGCKAVRHDDHIHIQLK